MIYIVFILSILFPASLQEAYDNATSLNVYDKYLILNPDSTYYGGLGL